MATHSSIPAWDIPCLEEPGGLQSMRLQKSQMTKQQQQHTRSIILYFFFTLIMVRINYKSRFLAKPCSLDWEMTFFFLVPKKLN